MVKVKICGITNWQDAKLAVRAGVSAIGLNFYRRSPRYISPGRAREIVRRLPRRVQAVGVFVNATPRRVREIARAVGLDGVQLHGDESPEMVAQLAECVPVIKAFQVRRGFRRARLARYRAASAFLLDGFSAGRTRARGGTGKTFDWRVARRAAGYGAIILAGGLTPENVAAAIRMARPFAVDVSSGVEARPGKKDPARVRDFMRQVKAASRLGPVTPGRPATAGRQLR
jgi:phosphoribosylanthranilate isomerase